MRNEGEGPVELEPGVSVGVGAVVSSACQSGVNEKLSGDAEDLGTRATLTPRRKAWLKSPRKSESVGAKR